LSIWRYLPLRRKCVELSKERANLKGRIFGPRERLGTRTIDELKHLSTVRSESRSNRLWSGRKAHTFQE